jgi:hypothetical protein
MMADSFLDTAGGLQQVADVNVVIKDQQLYVATDGSMQSALAITAGAGGAVVTDGENTLVSNSALTESANGTLEVANGILVGVTLDPSVFIVGDAMALQVPVNGTYVDTVNFAVSNGVITAITLS